MFHFWYILSNKDDNRRERVFENILYCFSELNMTQFLMPAAIIKQFSNRFYFDANIAIMLLIISFACVLWITENPHHIYQ